MQFDAKPDLVPGNCPGGTKGRNTLEEGLQDACAFVAMLGQPVTSIEASCAMHGLGCESRACKCQTYALLSR